MLAVRYTLGTPCEINLNQPRETTVFYGKGQIASLSFKSYFNDVVCDERGNDGVLSFEEVSSCYYEMTVASRWLCKLPEFRFAVGNTDSIDCFAFC
jgi:hypothetical protein